jgi:hypothetical protein
MWEERYDKMIFFWIALAIGAYWVLSKIAKVWFEHVYQKYNINAISISNQIVGLMFFSPLIMCELNPEFVNQPFVLISISVIVFSVMCIMNFKLKNPAVIGVTTLCQIFYACTFVVRLLIWFMLCMGSLMQSIFYGYGYTVTYNPIILNSFKNNKLVQSKKPFSYTPEPSVGILNNLSVYTYDINRSRVLAEKNRLENELVEVQNSKYEAMAYGFDIECFEMREKAIQKEIDSLH